MVTHWDDIYQNYNKGGDAWATLSEGMHPSFPLFVERSVFPSKHALDIGCGTGTYLQYLKEKGFEVDGIDTSETALHMTKDLVPDAHLACADMYEWQIPPHRYDFILSISTIHHGTKKQVASLVEKIYAALQGGGHIFITIPEWDSRKDWPARKTHELLGPGMMAPLTGPEKGLIHGFYTKEEVRNVFGTFKDLHLELDAYTRWVITGTK